MPAERSLLLVDTCPTPPRAYLASLGAGRAFACCKQDGQAARAVPLGRPHSAADAKEKGRLAKAGATASGGLVCGLPVSRSLGDGAAKRAAPGVLLPMPDVSSFDISAAQRFVLLGSSGAWKGGAAAGETAVQKLSAELARMDARRNEIAAMLSDDSRLALLAAGRVNALQRERDERACEGAVLADLSRSLAGGKQLADPPFALLLVRTLPPDDRAAEAKERGAAAEQANVVVDFF
ncbi:hypothetical protein EMIHUDRAFT_222811 [Emiliania huxleyi CCMP1516]|uniref:PPM-type phosphatase domain-containing protein n=2 Tax=Emiliania huxleyi TaxID=2903 RepID=A0A0D3KX75_EMIH1|nr:hypothetical protein EMIHUDRAFT_222811 [Emiliania huxleyi CCMP1516]EOD40360.1 hypothetical protein EMIHUDRAFT_222811 [Emiliania huxleyi CCMP1516]|eukprot:XP_005792789.1 hypothetical protein EMIHUDRAFT_222811 [Emiliania huxleyi CCMP1516]